jgi:hypothetical protein
MNWDAIGAVGEMVGALAVVVTLAYLALQIRASTKESAANQWSITGRDGSELTSRFMEHADAWTKGNAGDELTTAERFVFHQLVVLRNNFHFFAYGRQAMLGGSYQGVQVAAMANFLHRHPAANAYWQDELAVRSGDPLGADWIREVIEAVASLDKTEKRSTG